MNEQSFPSLNVDLFRFYPIVDSYLFVEILVKLNVKTIQLRIKNKPIKFVENEIKKSISLCRKYNVQLFINDYYELALAYEAFGIHLGHEDLLDCPTHDLHKRNIRLGLSTHSELELCTALEYKPTYIALGPIYPTTLKKMRFPEKKLESIEIWRKLIPKNIPLVAIGGLSLEKADAVFKKGADSIAVVSDITQHKNIPQRVNDWLSYISTIFISRANLTP
jgi:thiamine-phosphate diphosphorylase